MIKELAKIPYIKYKKNETAGLESKTIISFNVINLFTLNVINNLNVNYFYVRR